MTRPAAHIDADALERSLRGLRRTVGEADLDGALHAVLDGACTVFKVKGTGLMVIDADAALAYVAATDEPGRRFEQEQERLGSGPCVDSLVHDRTIQSRDLLEDGRWPELTPRVTDRGVRAVLGVPVHIAGEAVGSLNGYVDEPHEWSDSEVLALGAYADLVGTLLASAVQADQRGELARQLQHALDHRVEIERAVGMIMGVEGRDAVGAFNRLRRVARDRGERVAAVAGELLRGERLPEP